MANYPNAPALDDFDITITSTTDDEATVKAAVGLAEPPAEKETAEETPETLPEEQASPAKGKVETSAAERKADDAATKRLARETGATYEAPPKGETAEQREARIERNVQRIEALTAKVANRDQHIQILRDEIRELRTRLDWRSELATSTKPEAQPAAEPTEAAFSFPTWEEWGAKPENESKTHDDYLIAQTRAVVKHEQSLERQREARVQRVRDTEAVIAANQSRIDAFRSVVPDYDEAIEASRAPLTATMHMRMMQREWGPAFAYWASTTPEGLAEARRIAAMEHPADQVEALAEAAKQSAMVELIQKVKGTPAPAETPPERRPRGQAPKVEEPLTEEEEEIIRRSTSRPPTNSRAPAPAARVAGSARATRNLEDMSTDEFVAEMDRRDRERGRLR